MNDGHYPIQSRSSICTEKARLINEVKRIANPYLHKNSKVIDRISHLNNKLDKILDELGFNQSLYHQALYEQILYKENYARRVNKTDLLDTLYDIEDSFRKQVMNALLLSKKFSKDVATATLPKKPYSLDLMGGDKYGPY